MLEIDKFDLNSLYNIIWWFFELYDDKWIDVFNNLIEKNSMIEENVIKILLYIMEELYKYCKDIFSKRYINILVELMLWKFVVLNEIFL